MATKILQFLISKITVYSVNRYVQDIRSAQVDKGQIYHVYFQLPYYIFY